MQTIILNMWSFFIFLKDAEPHATLEPVLVLVQLDMNTKEESFVPPVIGDLQDVHIEPGTQVEHNVDLGDGFRSQRIRGPPHKLTNYCVQGAPSFAGFIETKDLPKEPNIDVKAITCQQHKQWEKAMQKKYRSLLRNKDFDSNIFISGSESIKCKWIYRIKINAQGEMYKCKVRVVAKGFFQTFSIDYDDTFSLVIKYDSIWSVLVIIIIEDFDIIQFDSKIAFFYVDLNEKIYMC